MVVPSSVLNCIRAASALACETVLADDQSLQVVHVAKATRKRACELVVAQVQTLQTLRPRKAGGQRKRGSHCVEAAGWDRCDKCP